jgi:hypothetical protein
MTLRRFASLALATVFALGIAVAPSGAAEFTTDNFVVSAPTAELAKTFGNYAEKYREEKAVEWLGREMPRWNRRCPLQVKITIGRTGGATTFTFSREGGVLSQEMEIFGEVPQLLNSVLPHEVTHTVLAHHFGQAVPRWADEGGSVLSENDKERFDHDIKCREFLNQGRGIPLKHLFPMQQYPRDMIVLYAQGYSVSQYLIDLGGAGLKGRQKFLQFVETGMQNGNKNWEKAVQQYGFESVDDLQEKWINALRKPPARLASRTNDGKAGSGAVASLTKPESRGIETRSSAVPALPQLEPPVVARGAAPVYDERPFSRPQSTGAVGFTPIPLQPLPPPPLTPSPAYQAQPQRELIPVGVNSSPRLLPPELPSQR